MINKINVKGFLSLLYDPGLAIRLRSVSREGTPDVGNIHRFIMCKCQWMDESLFVYAVVWFLSSRKVVMLPMTKHHFLEGLFS